MSYTLGEHHKAAMEVATDDQANALHAKLWQHRADNHERMSPAELDDIGKALHELEIGDATGKLASHRRNWQRRQTRVGEQQVKRDDERKPRARAKAKAKQTATRARQRAPRTARRVFERTGVPSATRSATGLVLQTFGVIFGLSIAYLLLNNAERGPGFAIGVFAKGVTRGMQLLVSTADPLNPPAAPGKRAPLPKPSVNPVVNPLAAGPPAPTKKTAGVTRTLPNYSDLLGAPIGGPR